MTSRPLLTRVAELIVMTGPIAQVGWASACSRVTSASSSRVRPRKGPPEAVTTSLRTSARVPAASAWKSAACSESTGMICPGAASAFTRGPPTISDSLLARASVRPAFSAARVGASPMEPVMPLSTVWQSLAARAVAASGPARISGSGSPAPYWSRSAVRRAGTASSAATATVVTPSRRACSARRATRLPAAESAVTRKRSGLRRTRSMAWVPMDPVEPRITRSRRPSAASKTRCGSARGAGLSLMTPIVAAPAVYGDSASRWAAPAMAFSAPRGRARSRRRPRGTAGTSCVRSRGRRT